MAITKETEIFKVDTSPQTGAISVREDTVIREEDVEISRIPHRHALVPLVSVYDKDSDSWTHTPTDLTDQDSTVQAVAEALWTDEVRDAFRAEMEKQPPI